MSTHPPTLSKPSVAAAGTDHDALPPGTRFGEFEILRVLGVGGFGIVYLARDHSLEREVALKEYMPASLAARGTGPQITVRSSSFAETYAIGLRSFINEARLLARFDHPSLVKVYRFWEDNATAYMVMPFLQGTTLRDTRRGMAHPPDEAWIRSVLSPILSALELLHREGVYHRDIAPDNILLPRDGPPVLLDFGAARRVISDRTQSLTAILKPSYAPIEQYAEMTQLRQGPWTDLYALGAVVHYLVFGVPPAPATARAVAEDGDAIENRIVPGISPRFLEAMSWMLAVRPSERPQSGEQLRAVLDGHAAIPPRGRPGMTIPGALAAATSGPQIERAAEAAQVGATYVPSQPQRVAGATATPAVSSFSPTTTMPTARTTTAVRPAAPASAPVANAAPPASVASSPPGALATSRPAASGPAAAGPSTRPAVAQPPMSGPAPLDGSAAARSEVPTRSRSRQWIALGGGGLVVVLAAAAAIQFAARRQTTLPGADTAASAATATIVPVPATVPAAQSTAPTEMIIESPDKSAPVAVAPLPSGGHDAKVAPSPMAAATTERDAGARPSSLADRAPLMDSGAASGSHARPVGGKQVPRADDPALATASGANPTRTAEIAPPLAGNGARARPGGQPARGEATRAVAAGPATAREACARKDGFFARAVCMDERCEEAQFRNVGDCPAILARKRQREH